MTAGGSRGFDARVAHPARVYDYWLGGTDNISQVVSAVSYSGLTADVQPCLSHYSKITSSAVRYVSGPCLGGNVRFIGRWFLTLA
jgi:S-adenosyl methyltransferase